ncbi:MAG: chemotaxis protein CheW [Gammaproteobacteria bacterium]|nr:chemotaxis protein CheW [Gammaproteobacteria bacterium]
MLYSRFYIGKERYVIAISKITVIVPYVNLRTVPALPEYAAGTLNYHGASVPVIDLCQLLIARPCARKLSTRIILSTIKSNNGENITIGFLVESATETFSANESDFMPPGLHNPEMPFIGPVASDSEGVLTRIDPQDIFKRIDEGLLFLNGDGARGI